MTLLVRLPGGERRDQEPELGLPSRAFRTRSVRATSSHCQAARAIQRSNHPFIQRSLLAFGAWAWPAELGFSHTECASHFKPLPSRSRIQPSNPPTIQPSNPPTIQPSNHPTIQPSNHPTIQPSNHPTIQPSIHPISCLTPPFLHLAMPGSAPCTPSCRWVSAGFSNLA
ncbi:PT repeat-containing protein [Prosthecobacter debontii]|uniref:PT repeat-containing protein n=1 Tax=Prosthecobacter debontii TaxID=48467 RepID=A0A1T4Z4E4_9BACT|nr:PT repeat-containing protein [Prosthecobacter debontii]